MCTPIIFYKLATNDVGEPSKSTTSSFRAVCPLNEARGAPRRKHERGFYLGVLAGRTFYVMLEVHGPTCPSFSFSSMLAFNTASAGDMVLATLLVAPGQL